MRAIASDRAGLQGERGHHQHPGHPQPPHPPQRRRPHRATRRQHHRLTRQDHTVWDSGNTPRNLGQNGYQQLPGWIIQRGFAASWGSGDGTITFPIAFPIACRSVQATHLGPDNQFWSARDPSTTGFTIRTSSSANSGYWWFAIGR